MTSEEKYDILIPVELHPVFGFTGAPGRNPSFNNEMALSVLGWPASFHETEHYRYLIVRTNCSEADARSAIGLIITAMYAVSIVLDAGVRPASSNVVLASDDVDLNSISIFTAGVMPHTFSRMSGAMVSVPIEMLSEAFSTSFAKRHNFAEAAEVFADIDFEASTTTRFVLIATVLELMAKRSLRDDEALKMIERWVTEAMAAKREDLATALNLMREQSITGSIRELIRKSCEEAGYSKDEAQKLEKRALELWRRRGAAVHGGASITPAEVNEFRELARLALTGSGVLCLLCAEAGWLILVNAWLRLEPAYLKLRLFLRV